MSRRSLSPEEEERIASLYADGRNSNKIAKELGLSYQTVYRRVQKFEAAKEVGAEGVSEEVQGVQAPVKAAPAAHVRKRRHGSLEATSEALMHVSTCEVYQGELLKFSHDRSGKSVTIELSGYEPICLSNDVFLMFVRDMDRMKALLSDADASRKTAPKE